MRVVGEAHSQWAPLRRKYSLFLAHGLPDDTAAASPISTFQSRDVSSAQSSVTTMSQFAYIDEKFLSWDFSLLGADSRLLGSVNRTFRGFGREIFTDTGAYVLRMDAAGLEQEAEQRHIVSQTHQGERAYAETVGGRDDKVGMTLDQRAVMLATAVTVDFDYFSRHSSTGSSMFPWIWIGGSGAEAGAAGGAAEAGAVVGGSEAASGAVIGGAGRAVGGAAGVGAGEGAMAGAGTMAGYEAMQRGFGRDQSDANGVREGASYGGGRDQSPVDDASPQADPMGQQYDPQSPQSFSEGNNEDVWGSGNDPWQGGGTSGAGAGADDEGGGGIISWLMETFFRS
jgi:hypothetical protein